MARRQPGAAPFLGADTILAQIEDRTLIKRLRAGLLPDGPPSRTGAPILTMDGEVCGEITSGCMSPTLGKNISIGYIEKPFNRKDTQLMTEVRGKKRNALTVPMPFVPTNYYRVGA